MKIQNYIKGAILTLTLSGSLWAQTPAEIPNLAGKILTVQGPIEPSAAGQTLMHEHIFINFEAPPAEVWARTDVKVLLDAKDITAETRGLRNYEESLAEIMAFKEIGGGTIVDTTNFGLTRDPNALLRVSKDSGLNVVMGAGWYTKNLYPADMDTLTVEQMTDVIVRDVTVGAHGTNIRSGIIGEVGVNGRPLIENELKSVRASARAARITGAPISIHNFEPIEEMHQILDIVAEEGVDLTRVVMAHTGGRPMDVMEQLFARGVYVEYDYMGQANRPAERDAEIIESIASVIKAGYVKQLMLAHDVCTPPQLKKNNGGGYTYIADVLVPGLKAKGVSDADIHTILVENPRRVLTFVAPQPAVKS